MTEELVYDPRQKETANHTLQTLVKEAAGTSGYMAPELAIAIIQGSNVTVGPDIDYYSLGPTLASIWLGRDIWEGISDLANCQRQSRLPFQEIRRLRSGWGTSSMVSSSISRKTDGAMAMLLRG